MARVKVNEFPVVTSINDADLGVVASPTTGISSKITWTNIIAYLRTKLGYKAEVNATTSELTSAALELAYPNSIIGDEVICKDITDSPLVYKKVTSTVWMSYPLGTIAAS